MRESELPHDPFAKKCRLARARPRPIKELVRDDHIERRVLLLQGPDRGSRQDALDAEQLHAVNIRAKRHLSRCESMTQSMTRQESDALTFECANYEFV